MIEARNPATLETIGPVEATAPAAAASAVAGVAAVTPLWAQLRVADRARYMERAAQAVIDDFDELVELIVAESGRPRVEIEAFELLAAIDTLQWLATNARRLLSARAITLPRALHPLKRASAGHTPRGVIAVISSRELDVRDADRARRGRAARRQRSRDQARDRREPSRGGAHARTLASRTARGPCCGRARRR